MNDLDAKFMRLALKEAHKASLLDEVPVGAVLVFEGRVVARAFNKRETLNSPIAHAEILVIEKASKKLKSWRLVDSTIYITLEPCPMCAGAILNARIPRVVYGAKDPKGGALGSSFNLFAQPNLNHYPEITSGILENECSKTLSDFFKKKRESKEKSA